MSSKFFVKFYTETPHLRFDGVKLNKMEVLVMAICFSLPELLLAHAEPGS